MLIQASEIAGELTRSFCLNPEIFENTFLGLIFSKIIYCDISQFVRRCVYKQVCMWKRSILFAIKTKFQILQCPYIINKNNATSVGRVSIVERKRLWATRLLMVDTCSIEENVVYYTKKICLGMMGFLWVCGAGRKKANTPSKCSAVATRQLS